MVVERLDRRHAAQTLGLLDELRLSLFGVQSRRLHAALVHDGIAHAIDCRIAVESDRVIGVVLAAPASYWRSAPLRHWGVAFDCVRARLRGRSDRTHDSAGDALPPSAPAEPAIEAGVPPYSWNEPAGAWRIILVGTAPAARGRGVAAQLYRSLMADRSLVAHIAVDNGASIRLHHSLGWRLYRDGDVLLALHVPT